MYRLQINSKEIWDEEKEEFYTIKGLDVWLEHSLVSISEWESKYHKPFLDNKKSLEETLDYIEMMVIKGEVSDKRAFYLMSKEQIEDIDRYINDPMTATVFSDEEESKIKSKIKSSKFVSSEEIYYWMTAQNIPIECETWHINRLITLIKICAIKNKPEDKKKHKMTSSDLALRRARMQAARSKYSKH